ncbi:MAG TPA: hypothetical protein VGP89_14380 [Candidatus Angelobacter sp.]|jgi:hypothetical protein|nr:hypothetical protein [Candidatus Angelobacter sp.]
MSTFKVLLISIACGNVLVAVVVLLSSASHELFLVPVVAMVCMPSLAILAGHLRKAHGESRLWTALAVAGAVAPFAVLLVLLIALMHSDI